MKKIIVPMDFTKASTNALQYALDLYGNKAEFTVVHVASGLLSMNETPNVNLLESVMDSQERQMTSLVQDTLGVDTLPSNVDVVVLVGNIVFELSRYVKEMKDFDAMVLATRDNYNLVDRWFGTVSLGLVKNLDIPVYLIPIYSKYVGYEKVVLASDDKLDHKDAISNIFKWNNIHKADIKFLYVDSGNGTKAPEGILNKENYGVDVDVEVVQASDISDALLAHAYNHHADLLIALPEHHSFIYTMLFKSISKELIMKSNIPILFFPKDFKYVIEAFHKEWSANKTVN